MPSSEIDYGAEPDCVWPECRNPAHPGWAICFVHGLSVSREMDIILATPTDLPLSAPKTPLVYYVALSPTVVKIGTTTNLPLRLKGLRTDLQYVLAIEQGSHTLEAQRHHEFAAERLGRREDFRVSDRLQQHINHLQSDTYSDEVLAMYRMKAAS
jgi:hypothetical protein